MKTPSSVLGRVALCALSGLLLAVIVVQALPKPEVYHYELTKPLQEWLPEALPGWTVEDVSIASTPEVQEAVDELLNFTDGIYRIYKSDAGQIKVYIAYWVPGKMDPRLVGVHSPDVCWVGAGWKQVGDKERRTLSASSDKKLTDGHNRTFEIESQREEVVFWHLVGGERSRYLEPGERFWTWGEVFRNPMAPRQEQFFVRISTGGKLDAVADTPMMKTIVERLSVVQSATDRMGDAQRAGTPTPDV